MDGILFFKDYLKSESVLKHPNFQNVYLPEVIELLNDEESYIRIEAIEILTENLKLMSEDIMDKEFLPVIFTTIDSQIEEIQLRLAQIIGKIAYHVKKYDLH